MTMGTVAGSLRRDAEVIGLIGTAHMTSHFFQLVLPPLFPLLAVELDVGYAQLGLLPAVFYSVSGLSQAAAGFVVDRVGAPRVLIAGMLLLALATTLAGLAPGFWALLPLAALAGIGNSVFHPADFAILNASVDPRRLGRAFSVHGIGGNLGYALAPIAVLGLASMIGWRMALVSLGTAGAVLALALATRRASFVDHRLGGARAGGRVAEPALGASVRSLLTVAIVSCFAYFTLQAMSTSGVQSFTVPALMALYAVPLAPATTGLTCFLLGSAAGVLAGGFIADRWTRRDLIAAAGVVAGAAMMALVATGAPPVGSVPVLLALAGFFIGTTGPSRDLLVRAAAPVNASGKVYGFVYSGLDLGSAAMPLLMGVLLDHGRPELVFAAAACTMFLTVFTILQVSRRTVPHTAAA